MPHDGELFVNKIKKTIINNKSIYYGKSDNTFERTNDDSKYTKTIYQKLNDIFRSRNYIYKADVIIKTNNGEFNKIVIGRNSNYLITNESELIPIADILDIRINKKTA